MHQNRLNSAVLLKTALFSLKSSYLIHAHQSCSGHQADYTHSRAGPGAAWLPHWPSQLWWGLVDWGGGRQYFYAFVIGENA